MATVLEGASVDSGRIQYLGLHNITIDMGIQSRDRMHIEACDEWSALMLEGHQFPPPVVYFDGEIYWLSEGFHRFTAAKSAGLKEMRCLVREGSRTDAIVNSAGSNKGCALPISDRDRRRALYVLFAIPEWWVKSPATIGIHVGVSAMTVRRLRAFYANEKGVGIPSETVMANGTSYPRGINKKLPAPAWASAAAAGEENQGGPGGRPTGVRDLSPSAVTNFLNAQGFRFRAASLGGASSGVSGRAGYGCVAVTSLLGDCETAASAFGRCLLLKGANQESSRAVVICDPARGSSRVIAAARRHGVEFLTPIEFADSLKGLSSGHPDAEAV